MPIYISLANYTEEGIANIKDSPERLEAVKKAYESAGGKLLAFYLTMGQYDMVVIGDVPDDKTVAKLALAIGAGGSVRTETFRAFTEDEYREIVASLP